MVSIKSRLLSLAVRLLRKRYAATAEGVHRRLKSAKPRQNCYPPKRLDRDFDIRRSEFEGNPLFEMIARGTKPKFTIIYLHGGAYLFEMTVFHWKFLADLATRLNTRIIIPIYPLAPENNWRDVFAMVMPLYRRTIDNADGSRLVLMGDSAGGGLAAAMALEARNQDMPAVDQIVLLSPWLDLSLTNRGIASVEPDDPWLGVEGAREAGRLYADGHDLKDYRLSPIYGDLAELPPTRIYVGTRDILAPDCISFTEIADACGCDIELVIAPDMFHVWMLFDIPEAQLTRKSIVDWLTGQTD